MTDSDTDTIRRRGRGSVPFGIVLVTVGLWFFLRNLGFELPGATELWPIFPSLAGAAFIISFVTGTNRSPGLVFLGTAGVLVGLFFFTFTVGPLEWWRMEDYWPAFPLIAGLAVRGDLGGRQASRRGTAGACHGRPSRGNGGLLLHLGLVRGVGDAGHCESCPRSPSSGSRPGDEAAKHHEQAHGDQDKGPARR